MCQHVIECRVINLNYDASKCINRNVNIIDKKRYFKRNNRRSKSGNKLIIVIVSHNFSIKTPTGVVLISRLHAY